MHSKRISAQFIFILAIVPFLLGNTGSFAQVQGQFQTKARVTNEVTLLAGERKIKLWGIERIQDIAAPLKLRAISALQDIIKNEEIRCDIFEPDAEPLVAQCVNKDVMDLSLYMIQNGFVTVDRNSVFNTDFENVYLQAELAAQGRGLGIWGYSYGQAPNSNAADGTLMISFGFILFLCIIFAFAFLSIIIMRGFKQVIEAQNDHVEMMRKERHLREQEREIIATLFYTELESNKSKIEAYLVVYDEVLKLLQDPAKTPKYKRTGDIIQNRPALERSIFDRNADKLDVLGKTLSSDLVKFYTRVKAEAEYVNLEPEMSVNEAINIVKSSLQNAEELSKTAEKLLKEFEALESNR